MLLGPEHPAHLDDRRNPGHHLGQSVGLEVDHAGALRLGAERRGIRARHHASRQSLVEDEKLSNRGAPAVAGAAASVASTRPEETRLAMEHGAELRTVA